MKHKDQTETYKDPVCGMEISRLTAPASYKYNGKIYYFCADMCRDQFESEPDKYLAKWLRKIGT